MNYQKSTAMVSLSLLTLLGGGAVWAQQALEQQAPTIIPAGVNSLPPNAEPR